MDNPGLNRMPSFDRYLTFLEGSQKNAMQVIIVTLAIGFIIALAGIVITFLLRKSAGNERFKLNLGNFAGIALSSTFAGSVIVAAGTIIILGALYSLNQNIGRIDSDGQGWRTTSSAMLDEDKYSHLLASAAGHRLKEVSLSVSGDQNLLERGYLVPKSNSKELDAEGIISVNVGQIKDSGTKEMLFVPGEQIIKMNADQKRKSTERLTELVNRIREARRNGHTLDVLPLRVPAAGRVTFPVEQGNK